MMTVIPTRRPWFMLTASRVAVAVVLLALASSAVVTVAATPDMEPAALQLGCASTQS